MHRCAAALLTALALGLAACGGDDDEGGDEGARTATNPVATETVPETAPTTTETAPEDGGGEASGDDEEAVRETILTYLFDGECDTMTDDFLETQSPLGDTRAERCRFFENAHQRPQYERDHVNFNSVEVEGNRATVVVGDDISNVESTWGLVRQDGRWRIDSFDL